jgi:AcrR family transcriptional regulator
MGGEKDIMGTAERREREKEHRRHEIVDAAQKVFFSKGLANATVEEVAEEAELSKGTIYLYFRGKDDLYHAVIQRGLSILRGRFETAFENAQTGLEKIEAIGRAFFEFCTDHPDYFQAMLHFEASDVSSGAPSEYAAECMAESDKVFAVCARAVETGIGDGSLRGDLEPMKTAMTLYGVSVGVLQAVTTKREMIHRCHGLEPQDVVETFFDLMERALAPAKGEGNAKESG